MSSSAYIELHARSAFSFLRGAAIPEDYIACAAVHNSPAMALTDVDGVYGAPRFHMTAKKSGMKAHIGAEITTEDGSRCTVLVESRAGYQDLCRLVTRMKLRAVPKPAAGNVVVRQRPGAAKGIVFLSMEDETGIANVVVMPDLFEERRLVLVTEPYLLIEGKAQNVDNVIHVLARRVERIHPITPAMTSHDFK